MMEALACQSVEHRDSWATVLFTRALRRANRKTTADFLNGPVVVIFGDYELMKAL